MSAASGDSASVSVSVRVPVAAAFAAFTEDIDAWWRHGVRFRVAGRRPGRLTFTPGLGGRLVETVTGRGGVQEHVLGTVTVWQPPVRFVLEWRGVNFAPDERTEVEVTFQDLGGRTLVTVRHRGWADLRDDHPARHGQQGAAFSRTLGLWWGDLMTALREHLDAH